MLPFKKEFVPMILSGQKTETRRMWDVQRVRENSIHECKCEGWFGPPFARIRVDMVWKEKLSQMSDESAIREGFEDVMHFVAEFVRINSRRFNHMTLADMNEAEFRRVMRTEVYVVRFSLVEKVEKLPSLKGSALVGIDAPFPAIECLVSPTTGVLPPLGFTAFR